MSVARREKEADAHATLSDSEAQKYDPTATLAVQPLRCGSAPLERGAGACWTSVANPTEAHLQAALEHRRHASDHRKAAKALRDAEARACVGIAPDDRDISPFLHVEDIAIVEAFYERPRNPRSPKQRLAGAVVTFRALPGMTKEWLQQAVDCHIARNSALGHDVPEMPTCPLVLKGVEAKVQTVGNGFAVTVRSDDENTAAQILARAQRLTSKSSPPNVQ